MAASPIQSAWPTLPASLRLRKRVRRFAADEDGSLIIFSVYMLVIILMVAGIGIDLMRLERDRSALQSTLDRAVLAAADLDQTLEPTAVVQDYLNKSGLGEYLQGVTVSQGIGYRIVSATARTDVETQFMHMNGIDSLAAPAAATAAESIDGVEVSLVLDVSGSMNSYSRLTNLKVAAKDFVDEMVANSEPEKLSISIIPYATQVSLPDAFAENFNLEGENEYSNCVNFASGDFSNAAVSTTEPLQRTMHFDPWNSSDRRDNGDLVQSPVCEDADSRELMVMQNDADTLKTYIENLFGRGNTSIDVGMKWGTALLDPAMRPVINTMIGAGLVPAEFSTRPMNYNDSDVLKVIVLMTDGANTTQYFVEDDHREGNSYIWWNQEAQRYSVYYPGYNAYYLVSHSSGDDSPRNRWADHPFGLDGDGCVYESGWVCGTQAQEGESVRLTYPELWAQTPVLANVEDNYYPWMNDSSAYSEWYSGVLDWVNSSTKDARTYTICDTAKDQDIIVFTIAFEAPYQGRTVLRECASSAAHYYNVSGLEISDAFSSIATSIRKLRLTQ